MADTTTPNYNLVKPEISGSVDTWGNKLNGDMDIIDTAIKGVETAAMPKTGGTFTGQPKFASAPTVDVDLCNKAYVDGIVTGTGPTIQNMIDSSIALAIPKGVIAMWGGTIATIPSGWGLCDGSIQNGLTKPDLRDKFIMGASVADAPGSTGGSLTHSHVVGNTTLTAAQIPSHTHVIDDPGHFHSASQPSHTHQEKEWFNTVGSTSGAAQGVGTGPWATRTVATGTAQPAITVAPKVTGVTAQNTGGGSAHTHTLTDGSSIPPYYRLAFIIRVLP